MTDPRVGEALFGEHEEWATQAMSALTDNAEVNQIPPDVFVYTLATMLGGLLGSMIEPKSRVKIRDIADQIIGASMKAGIRRNPHHQ